MIHPTWQRAAPTVSVVVYDHKSGEIIHVHHFAAVPGAKLPTKKQLHEQALKMPVASHNQRERSIMRVLEIDREEMKPKISYKVNVKKKCLMENDEVKPGGRRD
jgi:hypothetical protein